MSPQVFQVRQTSPTGDVLRGAGLQNFINGVEAVAQVIGSTLRLFTNEWWESLNAGVPVFTQLLDHPTTTQAVALTLRTAILAVPYVTGITSLNIAYLPGNRAYVFSAVVTTAFGPVTVSTQQ